MLAWSPPLLLFHSLSFHFDFSLKVTIGHQLQTLPINLCACELVSKTFVQYSYTLLMKEQITNVLMVRYLVSLSRLKQKGDLTETFPLGRST